MTPPTRLSKSSGYPGGENSTPVNGHSSFQNLVSLANANERLVESTKKFVWRDVGDPPALLYTLTQCLEHGAIGGIRAAIIAYGIRSGISVFLVIFGAFRNLRRFRVTFFRHALFSKEARRFGAMMGTFVCVYKIVLNALPILALRFEHARNFRAKLHEQLDSGAPVPDVDSELDQPLFMRNQKGRWRVSLRRLVLTPLALSRSSTRPPSPTISPLPHLSDSTKTSIAIARYSGLESKTWHAAFAGSLAASLAVMFETPRQRSAIGQQVFVRGLQGVYNAWSVHTGYHIPFGSVVVFSFCCGQILYSYLLKPETLDPSYDSWIQSMSIAPAEAVKMNRQLVLDASFDTKLLETILDGRSKPWNGDYSIITPKNRAAMLKTLENARSGDFGPRVVPCHALHPHHDRCVPNAFIRIVEVARLLLPVYGALHFIPAVLFKRQVALRRPLQTLWKALFGTIRSSTFIGVFVFIMQSWFCTIRNANNINQPWVADWVRRLTKSRLFWWFGSSLSGLSLLLEDKHRREELAAYVLPKAGLSAWLHFRDEYMGVKQRRRGAWKSEVALSAVGMGMVMSIYQTNPAALSGFVRRILYQFVGPN